MKLWIFESEGGKRPNFPFGNDGLTPYYRRYEFRPLKRTDRFTPGTSLWFLKMLFEIF